MSFKPDSLEQKKLELRLISAPFTVPPLKVLQPCKIVRVGPCNHQQMEQLVAMPYKIKLSGHPPLWCPCCVDDRSKSIKQAHHHLISGRNNRLRSVPQHDHLMGYGHHAGHGHAGEEQRPSGPKLGCLKGRHKRGQNRRQPK